MTLAAVQVYIDDVASRAKCHRCGETVGTTGVTGHGTPTTEPCKACGKGSRTTLVGASGAPHTISQTYHPEVITESP